jgi:hypothetical protein
MANPLAAASVWDGVAEDYAADLLPVFSAFASDALDLAAPQPGVVVLDVAARPGTLALIAARRVARVVAVDFSRATAPSPAAAACSSGPRPRARSGSARGCCRRARRAARGRCSGW